MTQKTTQSLIEHYSKTKRVDVRMCVIESYFAGIESVRHYPTLDLEGCGDNSCIVQKPKGMATNGGCGCSERQLRHAVLKLKTELNRISALRHHDQQRCSELETKVAELQSRTLR